MNPAVIPDDRTFVRIYEPVAQIRVEFFDDKPCGELEHQINNILAREPNLPRESARSLVNSVYCPRCRNYDQCLY